MDLPPTERMGLKFRNTVENIVSLPVLLNNGGHINLHKTGIDVTK